MTALWSLPRQAVIGGQTYALCTDFRRILRIIECLQRRDLPSFLSWQVALRLFYKQPIPPAQQSSAMEYLARFISGGTQPKASRRQLDWQQDAEAIIADVNRVAGKELRQEPYVHWWTFLSYFHSVGEGQLSFLVQLREKLRRGEKLLPHEQEFYRQYPEKVILKQSLTPEEETQKQRLLRLLQEGGTDGSGK